MVDNKLYDLEKKIIRLIAQSPYFIGSNDVSLL